MVLAYEEEDDQSWEEHLQVQESFLDDENDVQDAQEEDQIEARSYQEEEDRSFLEVVDRTNFLPYLVQEAVPVLANCFQVAEDRNQDCSSF